jgi:hypothetical protein
MIFQIGINESYEKSTKQKEEQYEIRIMQKTAGFRAGSSHGPLTGSRQCPRCGG